MGDPGEEGGIGVVSFKPAKAGAELEVVVVGSGQLDQIECRLQPGEASIGTDGACRSNCVQQAHERDSPPKWRRISHPGTVPRARQTYSVPQTFTHRCLLLQHPGERSCIMKVVLVRPEIKPMQAHLCLGLRTGVGPLELPHAQGAAQEKGLRILIPCGEKIQIIQNRGVADWSIQQNPLEQRRCVRLFFKRHLSLQSRPAEPIRITHSANDGFLPLYQSDARDRCSIPVMQLCLRERPTP